MKLYPFTLFSLLAGLCLAPMADAAPKGKQAAKKPAASSKTTSRKKKPAKKAATSPTPKTAPKEAPSKAAPAQSDAASSGTAPQNAYTAFKAKLKEQASLNKLDTCPALAEALRATDDEFAALEWMERAAKEGDPVALDYISEPWIRQAPANLLESDEAKKAAANMKKAADLHYEPAMVHYSVCLRNGIGVKQDEAAANRLLIEACKSGNIDTRFSWLMTTGRLKNFEAKDLPEVKSEIERGNHHILYWLSAYAPDSATQLKWLLDAAKLNNNAALYTLSSLFSKEKPKESYDLLSTAAKLHYPPALFALGYYLLDPPPALAEAVQLQKDEKSAIYMLRLASLLGNDAATAVLANAYYDGKYGLPVDHAKAFRHYLRGYESLRSVPCAASAGYMLLCGDGTKQDIAKGTNLLNTAANRGYPYACVLLAYAQYEGIGTKPDAQKALDYLSDATIFKTSYPEAYIFMAYITAKGGEGLKPDPKGAERYIRSASLDLGDRAQQLYDELMKQEKWVPKP